MTLLKSIKISDLIFDKELYPRITTDWFTVYSYTQMMRAGAVFPPIKVGLLEGLLYVVDGWHRSHARLALKEEYIQGTIKKYTDRKTLFVDAVEANIIHGRQLSSQEKVRIISLLQIYQIAPERISEIVRVPLDKIARFEVRAIKDNFGNIIYLKGLTSKLGSPLDLSNVDQSSFATYSLHQALRQLIAVLEAGIFPTDDKESKVLASHLLELLQSNAVILQEA
jgi:hypothetical protein